MIVNTRRNEVNQMDNRLFRGDVVSTNRIIYTPSNFAKTNLLYLQEIGSTKAQKPHISRRENLSSFLFFIVTGGSGFLEYEGKTHELSIGDCVFIDCKKPYAHKSSEDLWELKWVHFYGPNLKAIYEKYIERGGVCCFVTNKSERYSTILSDLYSAAESTNNIRDMLIYEKLTKLLTLLMEDSWQDENAYHERNSKQNLQSVKEFLDQNYKEKITLEDLSEKFYINKYYLTRIFKEQFGISVIDYLLSVRITHAKQLLRFSELTIEKVGTECGIPDANYFARIFKKIEGCAPGEYRRRW